MRTLRILFPVLLLAPVGTGADETPFEQAVRAADAALAAGRPDEAAEPVRRALERDPQSIRAWELRARRAEAAGDEGERVYALHRLLRLAIAQGAPRPDVAALRARLKDADPVAEDLLRLQERFLSRLVSLAERYEKGRRPHSAIRVHQEILALAPERTESADAIRRISAAPDPSLAETAQARDLLADVSEEWIRAHDGKHATWKKRAKLEREHYVTHTNAGYAVLVRAAEAMEQMNAFYRVFFDYDRDPPRIAVHIFRTRDEYLKLGIGPPVEWSGGHFTGGAVETYIGDAGFDSMTRTLFHEAAHQFVSLATNATGWLNEGLACFFEGCRILPNGTVLMNQPAEHRLFSLASRMEKGWMSDHDDGIDPADPSGSNPEKAPTFRIIIENRYEWGPPWYAPTWGVVYFLHNYQDPVDGRFVYREALGRFIDKSGGRQGEGAVENFEKVVLGHPAEPTPKVDFGTSKLALPRTTAELDPVWKEWILELRDVQSGRKKVEKPHLDWARHALTRKDHDHAVEHFEQGLVATPRNADLLLEFADFLAGAGRNKDRACKLAQQALQVLEGVDLVDAERIAAVESRLRKWDRSYQTLAGTREQLAAAAHAIVRRYADLDQDLMVMDLSSRFAIDLRIPGMMRHYAEAAKRSGASLALWRLAYNERDLEGWAGSGESVFAAAGPVLEARFDRYQPGRWEYRILTLDEVTSGDFSMETEVRAQSGRNAYCGLVFGRKGTDAFHAVIFFPGGSLTRAGSDATDKAYLDLASFYSPGVYKIWRHNPVQTEGAEWHRLRLDVTGTAVDVWFDGELAVRHEFPSLDVLRGTFGLVTGRGDADFRNVRYLARKAGDPGARIERELRMKRFQVPGQPVGGSWLEQVPPWPDVSQWVQGKRESWEEKGPVPTLFVIWSVRQNGLMPIHEWLDHVQKTYADAGLEIVSVAGPDDVPAVRAHLDANAFPGAVALDALDPTKRSYGETLDRFEVGRRFDLPRILLLDIDQKVVWEGGPGFPARERWRPGIPSYLDDPLEDLVKRNRLRELFHWRREWPGALEAFRGGDFDRMLTLLREARALPSRNVPEVARARGMLGDVESAIGSLEMTSRHLADRGCQPALKTLVDWAELLEQPVPAKTKRTLAGTLSRPSTKAWESAVRLAQRAAKKLEPGAEADAVREVIGQVRGRAGRLSDLYADELQAALDRGDLDAARRLLEHADRWAGAWLAREYFGF